MIQMRFNFYVVGQLAYREVTLKAGEIHPGHKHNFDHNMDVPIGRVLVECSDRAPLELKPGDKPIEIRKGVEHKITAREDSVFRCCYLHRDASGNIVPDYTNFRNAYR